MGHTKCLAPTKNRAQEVSAAMLFEYLKRHYLAIYELRFNSFSTYYALSCFGIRCVIA